VHQVQVLAEGQILKGWFDLEDTGIGIPTCSKSGIKLAGKTQTMRAPVARGTRGSHRLPKANFEKSPMAVENYTYHAPADGEAWGTRFC
jgi:hypothetical protein